jgi:hypothetical protein
MMALQAYLSCERFRRHSRLLRPRRDRPCDGRTAERLEKFAPPHISNPSYRSGESIAPCERRVCFEPGRGPLRINLDGLKMSRVRFTSDHSRIVASQRTTRCATSGHSAPRALPVCWISGPTHCTPSLCAHFPGDSDGARAVYTDVWNHRTTMAARAMYGMLAESNHAHVHMPADFSTAQPCWPWIAGCPAS